MPNIKVTEADDEGVRLAMTLLIECVWFEVDCGEDEFDEALAYIIAKGLAGMGVPPERIDALRPGLDVATLIEGDGPNDFTLQVIPSPLIGKPFALSNSDDPDLLTHSKLIGGYASLLRVTSSLSGTLMVDARNLTDDPADQWWTLRENTAFPGSWSMECDHGHDDDRPEDPPTCSLLVALHRIASFVTSGGPL